ncbi:hypothetical protein [Pseudomonas massiliensis]|uniref:hypothetical protein n=1 Tax=Pseudomonas massiliensis TaxID=522492 RepID=UPI000ADDCB48|nr:hypothetical protein [Pseudomonas massiliensis]
MLNPESAIAVILATSLNSDPRLRRPARTPCTRQGKWLALLLAHHQPSLTDGRPLVSAGFLKSVGVSARQAPIGLKDLTDCGWLSKGSTRLPYRENFPTLTHAQAIRFLLEYPRSSHLDFESRFKIGLKPDNRLLLVTLLSLANETGRIDAVSDTELMHLTGFAKAQLKCQMHRLKFFGLVSGVVPGATLLNDEQKGKTCIYLNLLHPCWASFYPGWKLARLNPNLENFISEASVRLFSKKMWSAQPNDDDAYSSRRAYADHAQTHLRNRVIVEMSAAARYITSTGGSMSKIEDGSIGGEIPGFVDLIVSFFCYLREEFGYVVYSGTSHFDIFVVLPFFGSRQPEVEVGGFMLLTNSSKNVAAMDSAWLAEQPVKSWIRQGIVTDAAEGPRKYGSRKRTIGGATEVLFREINT